MEDNLIVFRLTHLLRRNPKIRMVEVKFKKKGENNRINDKKTETTISTFFCSWEGKMDDNRFKMWFAIVFAIVALVVGVVAYIQAYGVYADVDARLDRAQLSPSPKEMANRLDEVVVRMESYGMTSGHAAVLFKNPINDVGLDYATIKSIRDRARQIQEEPVTSVAYQTAMKDMRDTLTALKVEGWYWFMIRQPLLWIALVFTILAIVFAIWWVASS